MSAETTMIRTAVLGASGYTGAELVRLISTHPHFEIAALTADRKAGQRMSDVFPHLAHFAAPDLIALDALQTDNLDLVFCALPHATTQEVIAGLPSHLKIVDLSADFRLEDPARYEEWYGAPHLAPDLQREAVYGLPEVYREDIRQARLVANTGCYVATALLALLPVLRAGAIAPSRIIIDAKSGVSGAGRAPKEGALFCEVAEGFHAYGVGGHRHVAELDQELSKAAGVEVRPIFTPHLIPQNRGVFATIYADGDAKTAHAALTQAYADEPFVIVRPFGQVPQTRHVRGSNFVHIGVVAERAPGRCVILSTLDNLVKGASGQAVQNANLMMGQPETAGLMQAPMFP